MGFVETFKLGWEQYSDKALDAINYFSTNYPWVILIVAAIAVLAVGVKRNKDQDE